MAPPRIALLDAHTAQRIAAGEVIDRPAAIIRELIENSIDAEASHITVEIRKGGIENVRVIDDGHGMERRDLEICTKPHATSKIRTLEDLERVATLGFRGEALASIAAVARVTIISGTDAMEASNRLEVDGLGNETLHRDKAMKGTIISVRDLFYVLPPRRRALRAQSFETNQCRQVFLEKAAAFPNVEMRFVVDGTSVFVLSSSTQEKRIAQVYKKLPQLYSLQGSGPQFTMEAIAAMPQYQLRDRKYLQLYVNRRRVREYNLLQAMEYAYAPYMPGGVFPALFVFLRVDPECVDFNVHPAKKEVRLRNRPDIRSIIIRTVRGYMDRVARITSSEIQASATQRLFQYGGTDHKNNIGADNNYGEHVTARVDVFHERDRREQKGYERNLADIPIPSASAAASASASRTRSKGESYAHEPDHPKVPRPQFHYIGQVFRLFLIVQVSDRMLIIDQHAAHEKVLYNQYRNADANVMQKLLHPIVIEANAEQHEMIISMQEKLQQLGIELEQSHEKAISADQWEWKITAAAAIFLKQEHALISAMEELLQLPERLETIRHDFYALLSCRAAIKAGAMVSYEEAVQLIEKSLTLTDGRCPHGRPIWFELSRDELTQFVGRI